MIPLVLGLDLSLTATGAATRHGELRTYRWRHRGEARLKEARDAIELLLEVEPVNLVVIEGYSYGSHTRSFDLAELGGVVKTMLFERGESYVAIPPTKLKKFATGTGIASKAAVVSAYTARTGREVADDNQADAGWLRLVGLHLCGAQPIKLPAKHLEALRGIACPDLRPVPPPDQRHLKSVAP